MHISGRNSSEVNQFNLFLFYFYVRFTENMTLPFICLYLLGLWIYFNLRVAVKKG